MSFKIYRLKDGSIYWHKLYYDNIPKFLTANGPPFGNYNWAYYLYQPHRYFLEIWDEMGWFVQRGIRGWSDCDAWNWYTHHSKIMVEVLEYLRKHKHGHPRGLTPGKWDKKLKIMEKGFQAAINEENDFVSYKKLSRKEHWKLISSRRHKLMLGLKYFREYYYNLWN